MLFGAHVSLGCPAGYDAPASELDRLRALGAASGATVRQSPDPVEAAGGATAVHTDTWVGMGMEAEKAARIEVFRGYTVDSRVMAAAEPGAGFYHCLPAYRGYEVSADVIDGPSSHVVAQAHNRMHAARGLLAFLHGVR